MLSKRTSSSQSATPEQRYSATHMVVYLIRSISTSHVCPNAGTLSSIQIRSGQAIKCQSGCFIKTLGHMVMDDKAEDVENHLQMA
jgi:hypothetical protein